MNKKESLEIYNINISEIYKMYNTTSDGLSEKEAEKRLLKYGENKLTERKRKSNLLLFLEQFNNLLTILLIFAAIFSFVISYYKKESYIDSLIIIIIVIINSILSFIQEKKADVAINELNKMFITNNKVFRNGKKKEIDAKKIVIGDIVELEAGDYVSIDGRIIYEDNLEVNESTLTGESKSIKKSNKNIKSKKELYERENMVFAGSNVTKGHALIVVTGVAMDTELGKIANSLMDKKSEITPLQKKINNISKVLTYIILIIIIAMLFIGVIKGQEFFDILMLSISLAVAAIPEGLSSIITIILSLGMASMAKKNVIIRKMSSVETLGSTDIICSDKTGTITQNKMLVKSLYLNDKLYTDEENITNSKMFNVCASVNHNVVKDNDKYIGDETEIAIYKYLENIKYKVDESLKRIKEYPFDSDRKMMTTINELNGKTYSFTKGSLDSIINRCSKYLKDGKIYKMTENYRKKISDIEKEESKKSLRLLAFSYKEDNIDDPENDMIFIGLIGMMDPPRENVSNSIYMCQKSGIKPIMITGDSINTANQIAKQVGIINKSDSCITGKEIDKMTDEELYEAVNKYQVYARITPTTKLRIVDAFQKKGLVVAMTGDGVNDAPAIQKADIGIGMGITGTEVVKKVSDCILVDDSFSTIVDGVKEGRRITSNIKKVILYLLAGNIVEVVLVFSSLLLNMRIFTTLQLLWINLITDSIPAIMLSFEKEEKDIMDNSPCNRNSKSFFTPFLISKLVVSSIFKSIIMIFMFIYYSKTYDENVSSSLMFIYLILNELLYAFSCRNLKHSVLNKSFFENKRLTMGIFVILLIQILVLTTGISKYFISGDLKLETVFITLLICVLTFIIGELIKPVYTKLFKDYI